MRILHYYRCDGLWWVRLFGYGLHWKDTRKHKLRFSERNGYDRALTLGPWRFKILDRSAF